MSGKRGMTPVDRFWAKVRPESGDACWQWTAGKLASGFGSYRVSTGLAVVAHRYSYELAFGPVPDGKFVAQTCGNKLCVAPHHLVLQSQRKPPVDAIKRLLGGVTVQPNGCWNFGDAMSGYTTLGRGMDEPSAHRFSYEFHKGEIPDGLYVLHSCDNKRCVNPDHLHVGTAADNMREKIERKRHRFGEEHGNARLTDEIVRLCRARHVRGCKVNGIKAMADEVGVSDTALASAVHGKTWSHVT